jgi:L-malate glycosyltransferase
MLTVLMATRNRAQILREVLESYCRIVPPHDGWKLVVIDNGSTDETTQVLDAFQNRLPLQVLSESRPGKSCALNTGLKLSEGDLCIFTDDDTFPEQNWLIELRKAAHAHPEYTMFGGAVTPRWESQPVPEYLTWIDQKITYGLRTLNEGPIPPHLITGANMMIRKSIFDSGIRFDSVMMAPRIDGFPMGDETELLESLGRQGHKGWHVPTAVVEHLIQKSQMNKDWILHRAVRFGRGIFRLRQAENPTKFVAYPLRIPIRNLIRLVKPSIRMAAAYATRNERAKFVSRWKFNYLLGMFLEARYYRHEQDAFKAEALRAKEVRHDGKKLANV